LLAIVDAGASLSPTMVVVSGTRLAVAALDAGRCLRVPAVASLGQRVGSETDSHFVRHDVIDDGAIGPRIEVVHELRALVSEEPRVFETGRTLHALKSSGIRLTLMGPGKGDIDARLSALTDADTEIAQRAKARVVAYRRTNGIGDEPYAFPTYKSAEERKVWVHKWWVRPLRFVYRNLPAGLRSRIKRVAT